MRKKKLLDFISEDKSLAQADEEFKEYLDSFEDERLAREEKNRVRDERVIQRKKIYGD